MPKENKLNRAVKDLNRLLNDDKFVNMSLRLLMERIRDDIVETVANQGLTETEIALLKDVGIDGGKISTIKAIRARLGLTLEDAKKMVEAEMVRLGL